jgi:flagellar biosynthetic protein FliQ
MTQDKILEIMQDAVRVTLLVSAPPLVSGLIVGLTVSLFQAVTSIQEQTLAFIPKIVAVLGALIFFGAFMMTTLTDFIFNLYSSLPSLVAPK